MILPLLLDCIMLITVERALCAFVSLDTSSAQIIDASEKQETPISLDGSLHGFVISCVF